MSWTGEGIAATWSIASVALRPAGAISGNWTGLDTTATWSIVSIALREAGPFSGIPGVATLVLSGLAPGVFRTISGVVNPLSGIITAAGNAPVIILPGSVTPPSGAITLINGTPTVVVPGIIPTSVGAVALVGRVPMVTVPGVIATSIGTATFIGNVPIVVMPPAGLITPSSGGMTISGVDVRLVYPLAITPATGTLILSAFGGEFIEGEEILEWMARFRATTWNG